MAHTVEVIFKTHDGEEFAVAAEIGDSLMETAIRNNVPGIEAQCGGSCVCATCHVYCGEKMFAVAGMPEETESEMLETTACERRQSSRLSCQIKVVPEMAGAFVEIPEEQF